MEIIIQLLKIVFGKLTTEAPILYFLSFSLLFPFSQTASEDYFSEGEWLKPLIP